MALEETVEKLEDQFEKFIFKSVKKVEGFNFNAKRWSSTSTLHLRGLGLIYKELMCLPQVHYFNMSSPTGAKFWGYRVICCNKDKSFLQCSYIKMILSES